MDQALFHLINERWTNSALDLFMAALSNVEVWKPFLILAVLYFLFRGRFHGRAFVLSLLICLLVAENVTSAVKTFVDRRRPKQVQVVRMVELQKARPEFLTVFKKPTIRYSDQTDRNRSGPSFPSCHTANNTAIAICCTLFFPRRGWLYWLAAAGVAYSRIYLGAHWPSDVFGTFFLAAGETLLILALLEWLWHRLGSRWFPNLHRAHPSLLVEPKHTEDLTNHPSSAAKLHQP